ncbi:hypothetical protein [Lacrimispora defluvii]|uniref:Uncharacterized protein n=1 Tax=Lacrimispora defluvii TaxID=2719233 RepID=A0ABX1VVK1_9FIRM|nr:hypothetical protein [Lacrimispora defluvii]NNJ32459.1 hypothetical protein [Lacrimispora defluvii]
MEQKTLDEVIHNIIELQKKCQEISESDFNNIVQDIIKEICSEDDVMSKKFITAIFELIHDNVYITF